MQHPSAQTRLNDHVRSKAPSGAVQSRWIKFALAGASTLAIASISTPALAQATATTTAVDEATLGEIVVTARRRAESLQEVPQSVNAVSGDSLQKLQVKQFRDLQTVVPGVNLKTRNSGQSSDIELRGVSFDSTTSAASTVAAYLNDAYIQPNFIFVSMYDIGQIEILKGPQGTQRGVPAPAGALTVTTRRPDLGQFGGYVDVSLSDLQNRNVNGAINIPIIRDVLGVRIAGVVDENTADGVRSLYSKLRPRIASTGVRVSVSFEPSDAFAANLMYSHLDRTIEQFVPVTGPGFAGLPPNRPPIIAGAASVFFPPAGLPSTPPIGDLDNVGVQDQPMENHQHHDVVTLQIDSHIFGQHLEYIGAYQNQHYRGVEDRDWGQILVGVPTLFENLQTFEITSHELRISSEPGPGRFFDYTAGGFYMWEGLKAGSGLTNPVFFTPGAFGPVTAPNLAVHDARFQVPLFVDTPLGYQNYAVFGSVTLHFGEKTELTGGLRHLWLKTKSDLKIRIPALGITTVPPRSTFKDDHTIYNVTLSHKFTPDLMVYGNVGTSYRRPFASVGVQNARNDPTLSGLQVHPPETSRAFEAGVKWTFLDGRGRLNFSAFKQKYKNFPVQTGNVQFLGDSGLVETFAFTANPDAKVDGFDIDASLQITSNWNVSGQLSYADARPTTEVPCNDSNFDGKEDSGNATVQGFVSRGIRIALCDSASISELPYWNATVQSEYVQPVGDGIDAYLRGLLTIYPKNAHASEAFVVDSYTLLNVYAGLRAKDGAWEAGLFVRNALNTREMLDRDATQVVNANSMLVAYRGLQHSSGYFEKQLTPRREVGISFRYALGSR